MVANASSRTNTNPIMEPIIRRGTHARVQAMDRAIRAFLSLELNTAERQIVLLGSGRDTTYLRYRLGHLNTTTRQSSQQRQVVRWYEVDHSTVICPKVYEWLPRCIPDGYGYERTAVCHETNSSEETMNESYVVSITDKNQDNVASKRDATEDSSYHLIGYDLRQPPSHLFEILFRPQHQYKSSTPTLFLLECVLMYLPEETSRELFRYISQTVSMSNTESFVAVAMYDPIPRHDRFGQVMIQNLQKVGIVGTKRRSTLENNQDDAKEQPLSLETTQTLSDQLHKLIQCGLDTAVGSDMMNAYYHGIIPPKEVKHASKCEMLDELEEFHLLMKHYCFCVGVKDGTLGGKEMESRFAVGSTLCNVGKDSLLGFQEGYCTKVAR